MKRIYTKRVILACCSGYALAIPSLTYAQDQEAADVSTSDIIVTANRRTESLQDVAMSVDVTTGDELQKLNLFDAKDIQALSPGLELTNTSGRNNTTTLRGVSFDPDQGTGPAVRVYLNEIPTDAQTVYTALYDIGQIEVLRGPQGLLRGLAAPAGAITIKTRRPEFDEIGGYVQATGTEDSAYNVQGGITLPFSDTFAIRVAALVDGNRLNQVYNVTRGDRSRSRTESARITFGWKPSADFSAYLTYQYLEADNTQYGQVAGAGNTPLVTFPFFTPDPTRSGPPAGAKDYIAVSDGPARFQNRTHVINLAIDWDLGPVTASFSGAHQYSLIEGLRDQDVGNATPNYENNQSVHTPYKVDTAELRLTTNGDGMFGGGVGIFYTKQTGTTIVDQNNDNFFINFPVSAGFFLPISTHVIVPVDSDTLSFNANGRIKFGKIKIEGGIRYSISKSVQSAIINVSSPGYAGFPAFGIPTIPPFSLVQDGVPAALQKSKNTPITGGVTLSYEPTDDLTLYASYGRSFRQGSAGVSVPVGISNDLIKSGSEKTDSYEVGVKTALLDRRLHLAVAAFYQKYDGFLSRFGGINYNCPDFFGTCNTFAPPINNATDVPATNGTFDFNYNGDATVKGIEASIDGRPTDNWDVSLNMSYVKARYDNALLPCNDFNGDGTPDAIGTPRISGTGNVSYCRSNGRLADIPNFNVSATTEVRAPIGAVTPFVRALVTYRPSVFSDRVNFDYQSRTLLNTYVGVRGQDDRWEINLFAKNLLNQRRITNASQGTGQGAVFNSGYRMVNVTNPREFGLTGTFKW